MELIRQPVFLLLTTASAVFSVFLSSVSYFGFGDDPILVKQSVSGGDAAGWVAGAVLSASNTLAREIRTGTALSVLAKPVGRAHFLLAKYVGLAAALAVLNYVNMVAALLASRMAFDAYGSADVERCQLSSARWHLLTQWADSQIFFSRRPFVSDALFRSSS